MLKRKATYQKQRRGTKRQKVRGGFTPTRAALVPLARRGYRSNTIEKKVFDIAPNNYQVNLSGSFTLLCVPVTGADMNARIGRKIQIRSVYLKGYVASEAANGATLASPINVGVQLARLIVFVDYQPNGAVPVVGDLLNSAAVAAHLNLNNRDRFKVLIDKQFTIDPLIYNTTATQAVCSATNQIRAVKKYKKCNIETIFNAVNGGTIADITSGALFMFWIGAQAAGANTDCQAQIGVRVRYTDL